MKCSAVHVVQQRAATFKLANTKRSSISIATNTPRENHLWNPILFNSRDSHLELIAIGPIGLSEPRVCVCWRGVRGGGHKLRMLLLLCDRQNGFREILSTPAKLHSSSPATLSAAVFEDLLRLQPSPPTRRHAMTSSV